MKRYCFDIDGTICSITDCKYDDALPFKDRIEYVNFLYDQGNHITYFTARGMRTLNGDIEKVNKTWYELTEIQLSLWGCKYHDLLLGKPSADYYIDDKGISNDFWERI